MNLGLTVHLTPHIPQMIDFSYTCIMSVLLISAIVRFVGEKGDDALCISGQISQCQPHF